ncbi:MAG: hypothetical protein AAB819_03040 [Patescibacteria group bacterium]
MKGGFIQIPILIAVIVIAVLGGGAYVAYEVTKPPQNVPESTTATTDVQSTTTADTSTTALADKKKGVLDEGDSVIDSLKKQVEALTQKINQPKNETPKTSIVTLPSGAVVEMDVNGNIIRIVKEASQQTYTASVPTSQNSPQVVTQPPTTESATPTPDTVIDASVPKIWEAQFGEQIRTHIPELNVWAPNMIRLVTNEPINVRKTKFRFRSPIEVRDLKVTFNIISENVARGPTDTCYVNCDKGGYYSTFFLKEALTAKVPYGASIPGNYDFEFLVVDMAGNYSTQWHSARDIAEFIFE